MSDARDTGSAPGARQGFTLLEVLLAVAVFGLVVGSLMQYLSQNIRGLARARDEAKAVRLAETLMRDLLRDINDGVLPEFGVSEGSFAEPDEELRWVLSVDPYVVDAPAEFDSKEVERLIRRSSVFAPPGLPGANSDDPTASVSLATIVVYRGDDETPLADPISVFAVEMPDQEALTQTIQSSGRGFEDYERAIPGSPQAERAVGGSPGQAAQ